MATKICENCGREFRSNYNRAKYCTRACYEEALKIKNAERYRKRTGKSLAEDNPLLSTTTKQARICPICGNAVTQKGRSKYCSNSCQYKAELERQKESRKKSPKCRKETLCWTCQNACCGCSWSKSFTPVEGWKAKPTQIKTVYNDVFEDSYRVIECPQYKPDEPRGVK